MIEQGSHEELLALDGAYAKLYTMTFAQMDGPARDGGRSREDRGDGRRTRPAGAPASGG